MRPPFTHHPFRILHSAFCIAISTFAAFAANVEIAGRVWHLTDGAGMQGSVATFLADGKTRKSAMATTTVDLAPFADEGGVEWSIRACGGGILKPTKPWLGLKTMLTFKDGSGTMRYPGPPGRTGDFGWRTIRYRTAITNGVDGPATFTVGLQETAGVAVFDLASLRFRPIKVERVPDDPGLQCEYSPALASAPPLRGFMLPSRGMHEEDFAKLQEWGVTLVRAQMQRNWGAHDSERDLDDYDAWLETKLEHLESRVLPFAAKYGMKVVIDLHMPPGGKAYDNEMNMFHEPEYAEHFIECWRRIARRFKGVPALFAYDLLNEPFQDYNAEPGCDYWTLQVRAAKAIREIDPDVPVIVEPHHAASPKGFTLLPAVPMKDVIYEVHFYQPFAYSHQGVNTNKPWAKCKWPDEGRGWNREFLADALAPVREFQRKHGARIYVGEFSCIAWAEGAGDYLRDAISLFTESGWDWTYHAFDEWKGWSVEHEGPDGDHMVPSADNPRKRALLEGLARPWLGNRE
jgi:hypothetical protein